MSLRHAILGLLHDGPMHGYQIATELERRIAGGRYNSAQVYQGLHWLAERNYIASEPPQPSVSRDRRPFRLTPLGRQEFERWIDEPVVPSRPLRDEAIVKLGFLGLRNPERLVEALGRLRRYHLRRLAGSGKAETPASKRLDAELFRGLTAAALRFRQEAEISWIDHALARIAPLLQSRAAPATPQSGSRTKPRPPERVRGTRT